MLDQSSRLLRGRRRMPSSGCGPVQAIKPPVKRQRNQIQPALRPRRNPERPCKTGLRIGRHRIGGRHTRRWYPRTAVQRARPQAARAAMLATAAPAGSAQAARSHMYRQAVSTKTHLPHLARSHAATAAPQWNSIFRARWARTAFALLKRRRGRRPQELSRKTGVIKIVRRPQQVASILR